MTEENINKIVARVEDEFALCKPLHRAISAIFNAQDVQDALLYIYSNASSSFVFPSLYLGCEGNLHTISAHRTKDNILRFSFKPCDDSRTDGEFKMPNVKSIINDSYGRFSIECVRRAIEDAKKMQSVLTQVLVELPARVGEIVKLAEEHKARTKNEEDALLAELGITTSEEA